MRKLLRKLKNTQILPEIDLSKRLPNYIINKWIFRFFLLIIGLILIYDISNYGLVSVSISCPSHSPEPCKNVYYVCPPTENNLLIIGNITFNEEDLKNISPPKNCQISQSKYICEDVPCNLEYLKPGEYYGRTDFMFKYGKYLIIGLFLFSFLVNHLYFIIKYKKFKPEWRR